MQGRAGKGFVSLQVFDPDETMQETQHLGQTLHGSRARMLPITEKHLEAFENASGVLMVSPFLPEGFQGCEWCVHINLLLVQAFGALDLWHTAAAHFNQQLPKAGTE